MTTFLGPVGSLIPVKCASRLTVSGGREVSFTRTLGKQKAFLGQVRARQWDVEIGLAKPAELSGLQWLAEYSNGPLVWYPDDAVVGNILSPQVSALVPGRHNGMDGPLVEVESGVWVKSVLPPSAGFVAIPREDGQRVSVPTVTGVPVTASCWGLGSDIRVTITWWDALGNSISTSASVSRSSSQWLRVSVTAVPPSNAVGLSLSLRASQVAGPAVTLTDRLMPYSHGKGAHKAVVHGLAEEVIRAYQDQQYRSLSFTVSEVG